MSLLGIDVGTTGCKAVAFSKNGEILAADYQEYALIHPQPGWAELDPDYIFNSIKKITNSVNKRLSKDKVKALAISCQGEAVIPVDKDGRCLYNAIVTFDGRTYEQYEFWKKGLGKETIFEITGMPLNPMYSINKIMWIKKHCRDIFKRTHRFLCFEDFIHYRLGITPRISYSLAARTAAFNTVKKEWSNIIFAEANIDSGLMSAPGPSGEIAGVIKNRVTGDFGFDDEIIITLGGHDQSCGAFGAGIIDENSAMNAAGTSDAITVMFKKPYLNEMMLENNYACAPYVIPDTYTALTFNLTGGLLLKWYRDNFCFEEKQKAVKTGRDVYSIIDENIYEKPVNIFVLPHFVGSGTPALDANSKGVIIGLDIQSSKAKLSRAILESNAYDLKLNLEKIEELGIKIDKVIAIGGGAKSGIWLQIKSDVLNKKISTLKNPEAASLGAALLAGISLGVYKDFNEAVSHTVKYDENFYPQSDCIKSYNKRFEIYKNIYSSNKYLLHRISKLD